MAVKLLLSGSPPDVAMLEHALARSAWDVTTEASTDGYHTVELAVRTRPDVIVTDPVIPRLFGTALIERLRTAAPQSRVICWAGSPDPEDAAELIRAGAHAYVLKDNGPGEVIQALGPVLDGGAVVSPRVAAQLLGRLADGIHRESELGRALAEATIKVQEVTHAKAEFLANVSHELRTPVTIVKGITHLLRERKLSEDDAAEFLKRMDKAVDRLTALVEEILAIADLDRDNVTFHLARSDLTALLMEVTERLGQKYSQVRLIEDMGDRVVAVVDPARISEAIAQLVDNACRYSQPGSSVTVRLRQVDEGILFSVMDRGLGLRRDVASLAFSEPFVTGEEILRKERAGVGLGLHLARRLILLHGGILWADPLPGGGTRVSFCIPTAPPGAEQEFGGLRRAGDVTAQDTTDSTAS
ncbi:MAG: ATP-binding protein [Actinomycetota bacterium]|nr:ATP-binding protein [Actinomycetota bacterium]